MAHCLSPTSSRSDIPTTGSTATRVSSTGDPKIDRSRAPGQQIRDVIPPNRQATAILQLTAFVQNWSSPWPSSASTKEHQMDFIQLDISVRAALSHKATNTIVRRLRSLTSYARWHRLHQSEPFLPQERDLWHYLQDDQVNSLLEALHWAHRVLGLLLQPAISTSSRLRPRSRPIRGGSTSQTSLSSACHSRPTPGRNYHDIFKHPRPSQLALSSLAFSAALARATSPEPLVFTSTFQTTRGIPPGSTPEWRTRRQP